MKIYRKCTSEPYSFLTIDTTLPADNSLRFRENLLKSLIKMTLTDEPKIFDKKIKGNKAQYDLDRVAAKISALSSKEVDKYEYLTGEDLGYKPSVVEKAKLEYSPLGEVVSGIVLNDKQNNKTDKIIKKDKQNKILVYNQQHNFEKFKDISDFKEFSLDSMYRKLNDSHKNLVYLKNLIHKQKKGEDLKEKILGNLTERFNELYYV